MSGGGGGDSITGFDDFLTVGDTDSLVDLFSGGSGNDTCFAEADDEVRGCEDVTP